MKREMMTQSRVKTKIAAALLGMLLALTACGGGTATAQPETASEAQVEQPAEPETSEMESEAPGTETVPESPAETE